MLCEFTAMKVVIQVTSDVSIAKLREDIERCAKQTVIPRSYQDSHNLGFSRFVMTEQSRILNHPLRLLAVTKDGREIMSEHFITAEQEDGQWVFGAILRPLDQS